LLHAAEDSEAVAATLADLSDTAASLKDFTDPATVTKAERTMEGIDEAVAKALDASDALLTLESQAAGEASVEDALMESGQEDVRVSKEPLAPELPEGVTATAPKTYCAGPRNYLKNTNGFTVAQCAAMVQSETTLCPSGYFNYYYNSNSARNFCFCMPATDCSLEQHQRPQHPCINHGWGHGSYNIYHVEPKKTETEHLVQYYPAMYFVDKKFEKMPMTCSGDLAAKPITGQTKDGCAAACDSNIHSCVGFQYFQKGGQHLCFLLSNFKTGSYYTGCGSSFLQTTKGSSEAGCYAKLSKFLSTTLKPNPSGKCKECFKELTKADRCFK